MHKAEQDPALVVIQLRSRQTRPDRADCGCICSLHAASNVYVETAGLKIHPAYRELANDEPPKLLVKGREKGRSRDASIAEKLLGLALAPALSNWPAWTALDWARSKP